jgi:hypothetical protein
MNVTNQSQELGEGTTTGYGEIVTWVASVDDQEQPPRQTRGLCKELKDMVSSSRLNLNTKEAQILEEFIAAFQNVFTTKSCDYGRTDTFYPRIDTGDAHPIRQPPRRLPLAKQTKVNGMLEDMRKRGVMEESESPWSSPVVLLRKKNGDIRFCVDYRKLNDITRKDCFPLPRIDDTLDTLAGANWFSTLYLKSLYWQVALHPCILTTKRRRRFPQAKGLWQFTVMLFGLCKAPATFERLMESVL